MSTEITKTTEASPVPSYCYGSMSAFEDAQRIAISLSSSSLVPKDYQGKDKIPNCLIALEVAQRIGASPLMVMQNLYIVHGRPSWSSQFIIAAINSCGRFTPLQFVIDGNGDNWGCYVTSKDKNGELLKGPRVNVEMAKKEGWFSKTGSKWQTMPEMMLRYRAASFFGKLYAPDVLMGMYTQEEAEEIGPRDVTPSRDNTALKESFLNSNALEEPVATDKPNGLDKLLDKVPEPTTVLSAPTIEIMNLSGEVLAFPDQIDTPGLMAMLQTMTDNGRKEFVNINSAAFPALIAFMTADNKPLAAQNLEKLFNGK